MSRVRRAISGWPGWVFNFVGFVGDGFSFICIYFFAYFPHNSIQNWDSIVNTPTVTVAFRVIDVPLECALIETLGNDISKDIVGAGFLLWLSLIATTNPSTEPSNPHTNVTYITYI